MENERLRITLNQNNNIYYAGQWIKGNIWMKLNKKTKIKAIKVLIHGKGKCKWMEILRKSSSNESARSLFYSSKEIYAHSIITVPGFTSLQELQAGEHNFNFDMLLDQILPSSFKGSHGQIKYKMTIVISRPWAFEDRHSIPLIIVKNMPLPPYYRMNPSTLEKQITKTINLFGAKPITLLAILPEDFAVCGEPLQICVTVTNNSTTNVEKLKFTVLQQIVYYSHIPLRIQKRETNAIISKETGSVHKKSERSFAHELIIPPRTQPSDDEFSGVINISYELRVEGVLRGFFKNLVLHLPFKVFSSELSLRPEIAACSSSTVRGISGNPFEAGTSASVYASMDSTIASPSHSSQYSESSSLHSTTSESSATTLSPAVNGYEVSSQSSGASQVNSPSARASVRSSQVYQSLTNQNSPSAANSCAAAAANLTNNAPESPQTPTSTVTTPTSSSTNRLSSAAAQTETASTSRNSLASFNITLSSPNTSSASAFLHRILHPAAHELPPSYEELFGASAPSVTEH